MSSLPVRSSSQRWSRVQLLKHPWWRSLRKGPQSARTALVLSGNAYVDGARQRGWFIGHFLESPHDLRSTPLIEVKWSIHHMGEEKSLWGVSKKATTLCVLLKGRISLLFPGAEYCLSREGDYVLWPAGLPHRWTVAEDALVLTIRWPSRPEDYYERTQSEMTMQLESLYDG